MWEIVFGYAFTHKYFLVLAVDYKEKSLVQIIFLKMALFVLKHTVDIDIYKATIFTAHFITFIIATMTFEG